MNNLVAYVSAGYRDARCCYWQTLRWTKPTVSVYGLVSGCITVGQCPRVIPGHLVQRSCVGALNYGELCASSRQSLYNTFNTYVIISYTLFIFSWLPSKKCVRFSIYFNTIFQFVLSALQLSLFRNAVVYFTRTIGLLKIWLVTILLQIF